MLGTAGSNLSTDAQAIVRREEISGQGQHASTLGKACQGRGDLLPSHSGGFDSGAAAGERAQADPSAGFSAGVHVVAFRLSQGSQQGSRRHPAALLSPEGDGCKCHPEPLGEH